MSFFCPRLASLIGSSDFDVDNEEADAREKVVVADGHADVRASAAMPDDNDDDADIISITLSAKSSAPHLGSHLLSTLISLSAPSTPTSTSLALTFSLPLPLSLLHSPLLLPVAAGEPF